MPLLYAKDEKRRSFSEKVDYFAKGKPFPGLMIEKPMKKMTRGDLVIDTK